MVGPQKRILLIDDDHDMHHVVQAILDTVGYQLTCCSTGPAGLQAMKTQTPDLLLLDIMLSTPCEGLHLARKIRSDDQLKNTPIIMISAIGERTGLGYISELGADCMPAEAFIEKPLEAKVLIETIQRVLAAREAPA